MTCVQHANAKDRWAQVSEWESQLQMQEKEEELAAHLAPHHLERVLWDSLRMGTWKSSPSQKYRVHLHILITQDMSPQVASMLEWDEQ